MKVMMGFSGKVAQAVSAVLDPRIEIPTLLILAVAIAYTNGVPGQFLALLLLVDVVLPLGFYWHLRQKGEIRDADMSHREDRVALYWFTTLAHAAGVGLAWIHGQGELAKLLGVFWSLALIFSALTLVVKISAHTGVNAALAMFLWWVWGEGSKRWLMAAGLVLLVGWSRVKLRKHRWWQVILGAVVAVGVMGWGLQSLIGSR